MSGLIFSSFSFQTFPNSQLLHNFQFIHLYHGTEELLNLYCAFTLIAVVLIMSFLSFWQEKKAMRVVYDFAQQMPHNCSIIRDCEEKQIPSDELVVGDIVIIR